MSAVGKYCSFRCAEGEETAQACAMARLRQQSISYFSRPKYIVGPNLRVRGGLRSDPHRLLSAGRRDSIHFNRPSNTYYAATLSTTFWATLASTTFRIMRRVRSTNASLSAKQLSSRTPTP